MALLTLSLSQVVVKQAKPTVLDNLLNEAYRINDARALSFSEHVVRLVGQEITLGMSQLLMEYCPQGSLQELLKRRIEQ